VNQTVADEVIAELGSKVKNVFVHNRRRVYIDVDPEDFVDTAVYLWKDRHARFAIASGLETTAGFEVVYHFAFDRNDMILSVRVKARDKERPSLPSVAGRIKAFAFIERELHDLLGMDFPGHPDLIPLLRAEDWPEDFYPLRRTNVGPDGKESST